jgi:hypothetical protein
MSGAFGDAASCSSQHLNSPTGSAWHFRRQSKAIARELFSGFFSDSMALKDASVSLERLWMERARRVRVDCSDGERLKQD